MNDYIHRISDAESRRIQRFLYLLAAGVAGFAVLTVLAVVTADSWLKLLSLESERRFVEPYIELVSDKLLESADSDVQAYVEDLATGMAAHMALPDGLVLTIRVIDDDAVNAFTTLGGYVFITSGLVESLYSENSLSMVIGHELAHVINRDPLLSAGRGVLLGLLVTSVSGGSLDANAAGDLSSQLMLSSFDREQEERADLMALAALQGRYGHVGGATDLFQVLREMDESQAEALESFEMFSTHPDLLRRIDYLRAEAAARGWIEEPVQTYPASIAKVLRTP